MGFVTRHQVLLETTTAAAATSAWFACDVRDQEYPARILQIALTTGDTVEIQGTTKDVKGIDKSFLDTLPAADISTIVSKTATGPYILEGPWPYIRVVKTGTTGVAKVQGFI